MYKLLVVTNRQDLREVTEQVTAWERLGFRPPRIGDSAKVALDCLNAHHIDAIAFDLPPAEQELLSSRLLLSYPQMPIFTLRPTVEGQVEELKRLAGLLNYLNADFSEDCQSAEQRLQHSRHQFFRELISGQVRTREDIVSRMMLLRSRMDPNAPCVLAELVSPVEEDFLHGRWQYGPERLEIAMRNFFGAELQGMRILVAVLEDERIFLLACPMMQEESAPSEDSITGIVMERAQDAIQHVREYLDLVLEIASVRVLPSLTALATEKQ